MLSEPVGQLLSALEEAPERAYQVLADAAAERASCDACAIYAIDASIGAHRRKATVGNGDYPVTVPASPRATSDPRLHEIQVSLAEGVKNSSPEEIDATFALRRPHRLVIGARRIETIYAFMLLDWDGGFDEVSRPELVAIVQLAFLTLQQENAKRALTAQEQPISIMAPSEEFYSQIAAMVADATGMQFTALRELGPPLSSHGQRLRCTAMSGYNFDHHLLDFEDYKRYTPFQKAIEQRRPTFSAQREHDGLRQLWEDHPELSDVQSFAVFPIADGEQVSAVLSVASSCRIDFTRTFESIVAGIARSIGYSLKNRELLQVKDELQAAAIATAAELNTVELFSDLTHQIRNELTGIPESLDLMRLKLENQELTTATLSHSDEFRSINESHDRVSEFLRQAGDFMVPPDPKLEDANVSAIWSQAVALVDARLGRLNVQHRIHGDYRLDMYPVLIRQVFFHLLLNSAAAFKRRRRHGGRIELRVMPVRERVGQLHLRYKDNAGGINPSDLRRRGTAFGPDLPSIDQAIFQRGVTGRRHGTGHGLWIVRQILQRHRGNIELVDYRSGGIVFDIGLPLDLRSQASRPKVM